MSIVAWDRKILAADRQVVVGDTIFTTRKLWKLKSGNVIAVNGTLGNCLLAKQWYERGAKSDEWPSHLNNEKWTELIVASKEGCFFYDNQPIAIKVLDPFCAWGIGREAALGAMEMGADAIKAVEVASKYVTCCGRGCDWGEVVPQERKPTILKVNKKAFMEI